MTETQGLWITIAVCVLAAVALLQLVWGLRK
jgi:hypothetical protein